MAQTELERAVLWHWKLMHGPKLESEHRFDKARRWRFDFAHPESRTAIECEGGVWSQGRHVRGKGYINDCEKYNAAAAAGWRVFRVPDMRLLNADPEKWLGPALRACADVVESTQRAECATGCQCIACL